MKIPFAGLITTSTKIHCAEGMIHTISHIEFDRFTTRIMAGGNKMIGSITDLKKGTWITYDRDEEEYTSEPFDSIRAYGGEVKNRGGSIKISFVSSEEKNGDENKVPPIVTRVIAHKKVEVNDFSALKVITTIISQNSKGAGKMVFDEWFVEDLGDFEFINRIQSKLDSTMGKTLSENYQNSLSAPILKQHMENDVEVVKGIVVKAIMSLYKEDDEEPKIVSEYSLKKLGKLPFAAQDFELPGNYKLVEKLD